jgi:uncharacterized protein YjeT (DUF2065 family)
MSEAEPQTVRRTAKERLKIAVFAAGVVLVPIGLGMTLVPSDPCDAQEQATKPAAACSTDSTRRDGAILVGVGIAAVWTGRMSLAARRKSSAWDRSWR